MIALISDNILFCMPFWKISVHRKLDFRSTKLLLGLKESLLIENCACMGFLLIEYTAFYVVVLNVYLECI